MKKEASQSSQSQSSTLGEKLAAIGVYSLCSSSMLVVNKLAVAAIPLPTVVSGAQLVSSAAIPLVMQACGAPVIGKMTAARVVPYALYTTMFAAGLFANMKALLLTNVGAVIAARCCLPLIVSAIEYSFMGRSWPNKRSMVSLVRLFFFTHVFKKTRDERSSRRRVLSLSISILRPLFRKLTRELSFSFALSLSLFFKSGGVVFFAYLYVAQDSGVSVEGSEGFTWLFIWWMLLALQMTYGKWITGAIEMTQWERVFYTNAFAVPPNVVIWYFSDDSSPSKAHVMDHLDSYQKNMLLLSCVIGVCISYSGWRCRTVVTATTFTLVGVVNKMATIAFTMIVWPKETTFTKVVVLIFCVLFGLLYQEAPMKAKKEGLIEGGKGATESNVVSIRSPRTHVHAK